MPGIYQGQPMKQKLMYWLPTTLLALGMIGGGLADVSGQVAPLFAHLGFPPWFAMWLGVCKLLGAATVLAPGLPRLKEWAYAGFVIDVSSAFIAHQQVGDPVADLVPPVIFLWVILASWATRPDSRRLAAP